MHARLHHIEPHTMSVLQLGIAPVAATPPTALADMGNPAGNVMCGAGQPGGYVGLGVRRQLGR